VLRVGVGANAYALNPEEVWKAWDANKTYAAFHTRTLVSKTANKGVRKRLTYILKPNQPPLPFDEECPRAVARQPAAGAQRPR
ncbi:hypothetical protein, partial [Rhodobacter capsulatus]|uniref:hypothetical protein n=1 Tax=Rhodobacter capsulatus TaxID=1061 RepID=UPI00373FD4EC